MVNCTDRTRPDPMSVECEPPAWRVRWTDGPTRQQLVDHAAALSAHRVGLPLRASEVRFARRVSASSVAIGWLVNGGESLLDTTGDLAGGVRRRTVVRRYVLPHSNWPARNCWGRPHCWPSSPKGTQPRSLPWSARRSRRSSRRPPADLRLWDYRARSSATAGRDAAAHPLSSSIRNSKRASWRQQG